MYKMMFLLQLHKLYDIQQFIVCALGCKFHIILNCYGDNLQFREAKLMSEKTNTLSVKEKVMLIIMPNGGYLLNLDAPFKQGIRCTFYELKWYLRSTSQETGQIQVAGKSLSDISKYQPKSGQNSFKQTYSSGVQQLKIRV